MSNIIEDLPEKINITVTKEDLIDFALIIINEIKKREIKTVDSKNILDVVDASELLHLSKGAIYKHTSGGSIPHYKQGKRLYFKKNELEDWMTENRGFNKKEIEEKAKSYILSKGRR